MLNDTSGAASASSSAAASLAPTRNNTYDNLDSLGSAMQENATATNMHEVSRQLSNFKRLPAETSALAKDEQLDNPLSQLLAIRSFAALNCQAAPTLGPPAHQQGPLFPQLAALRTTSLLQRLPSSQR